MYTCMCGTVKRAIAVQSNDQEIVGGIVTPKGARTLDKDSVVSSLFQIDDCFLAPFLRCSRG